ncbi:MAG: hypothetical protein ACXADY_24590 [Candidatus Hodarchaeales archaeon]|jgi:GTPase SAR1 family protein
MENAAQRATGFVLPVGGLKVGKTSIPRVLNNLTPEHFSYAWIIDNMPKTKNLEFEFVSTYLNYNDIKYKVTIQLYIPPGHKKIEVGEIGRSFDDVIGIYRSLIRRVDVVLLTYSLAQRRSFDHLNYWVSVVNTLISDNTNFILLGTYLDQVKYREVNQDQISRYLASIQNQVKKMRSNWNGIVESIEVSNLTGENLENLKTLIATQILRTQS